MMINQSASPLINMSRSWPRRTRRLWMLGAACLVIGAPVTALVVVPLSAQDTSSAAPVTQTGLAPAPGVDSVLDARVKAVASHLRCPVCQGESIQDSPAELAGQMKSLVREQLAAGKSEREVSDYFVQKYGQWILLEPRAEGINLLVYWLPVFFIVLGAGGIWFAVKRWTRPLANADTTADTNAELSEAATTVTVEPGTNSAP